MRQKKRIIKDRFGYIYIMSNVSLSSNQYKVGQTSKSPELRAKALSGTSLPTPFVVEFSIAVKDRYLVETLVFDLLTDYRSEQNREFFEAIDINYLIRHINYVAEQVNALPIGSTLTQSSYDEDYWAA